MPFDVPVLVPYRADGAERDSNWDLIKRRFWGDTPIFEGVHEGGPFNRSAALNRASDLAGDWDLAIIADADSVTDPDRIEEGLEIARETGRMVFPFTRWVNVHQHEAEAFLETWSLPDDPSRKINPLSNSALFIMPRPVWDTVYGFDERFVGWGYEDMAFVTAVSRLSAPPARMGGDVYHLEHSRAAESLPGADQPHYLENGRRFAMYERSILRSDLRNLVEGNRATLDSA